MKSTITDRPAVIFGNGEVGFNLNYSCKEGFPVLLFIRRKPGKIGKRKDLSDVNKTFLAFIFKNKKSLKVLQKVLRLLEQRRFNFRRKKSK